MFTLEVLLGRCIAKFLGIQVGSWLSPTITMLVGNQYILLGTVNRLSRPSKDAICTNIKTNLLLQACELSQMKV